MFTKTTEDPPGSGDRQEPAAEGAPSVATTEASAPAAGDDPFGVGAVVRYPLYDPYSDRVIDHLVLVVAREDDRAAFVVLPPASGFVPLEQLEA